MGAIGDIRVAIRSRMKDQITFANTYITADPRSFFIAGNYQSPALVLEIDEESMVEEQNQLIGTGQQWTDVNFNVYVAVRGAEVSDGTSSGDPGDDLGTAERNEAIANGIYDMIDELKEALMFYTVADSPTQKILYRGFDRYATAPYEVIYQTRWRVAGGIVIGTGA